VNFQTHYYYYQAKVLEGKLGFSLLAFFGFVFDLGEPLRIMLN
jgi:hypothetical protein